MEFTSFSFEYDDPIKDKNSTGEYFCQCSLEKLNELSYLFREFFKTLQKNLPRKNIKKAYNDFLVVFKQCNDGCHYKHYNHMYWIAYINRSRIIQECMTYACRLLRNKTKPIDLSDSERDKLIKIIEKEKQIIEDDFR